MKTFSKRPPVIKVLVNAGRLETEKVNPEDRYAAIGYDKATNSWYAWNSRVYNCFHVGSRVNPGNCAYIKERGAWMAQTIEDAKQMAIDFARGVA